MKLVAKNNASSRLAVSLGANDTQLTVRSGDGVLFPDFLDGSVAFATLLDTSGQLEIIKLVSRVDDTLTIERAQEETTAKAFDIGAFIEMRFTAGMFAHCFKASNAFSKLNVEVTTVAPDVSPSATFSLDAAKLSLQVPRGIDGEQGEVGRAGTVSIGAVNTGAPLSPVTVTNTGTETDAVLNFTIPRGLDGTGASIAVGTVTTGPSGGNASVVNIGDNVNARFDFVIPRGEKGDKGDTGPQGIKGDTGDIGPVGPVGPQGIQGEAATIAIGTVGVSSAGIPPTVRNRGTPYAAIFDFTLPKGDTGPQGEQGPQGEKGDTGEQGPQGELGPSCTVVVGNVTASESGGDPEVTNTGTDVNAVLDFVLPRGEKGEQGIQGPQGEPGPACTVAVGSVAMVDADVPASITNVGTSTNAVLNFVLPRTPIAGARVDENGYLYMEIAQ